MDAHILTQERLIELLHYEQSTGAFSWVDTSRHHKNKLCNVGYSNGRYWKIMLLGKSVMAHRLAWLYVTGRMPNGEIDHINGNRLDNSFVNLRDVSHSVNMQNQRHARANNTTKVLGIRKCGDKFTARIGCNGKRFHLGMFETKEDAHHAYIAAKRIMHTGNTI